MGSIDLQVRSNFTYRADSYFLKNDIRMKPDLDGLGNLGDAGWYCIRSILWAADYKLPNTVIANRNPTFNDSGVILSFGASLIWEDGLMATFDCSALSHLSMDLCVSGTNGVLRLNDFLVPLEETSASFTFSTSASFKDPTATGWKAAGFADLATGWRHPCPSKQVVQMEIPQEARMIVEFSKLVAGVKREHRRPEMKWAAISRKTQLVVDAVKASIENGFTPVDIQG